MKQVIKLVLILFLGSLSAQNFVSSLKTTSTNIAKNTTGRLNILAVMVEFELDKNTTTAGNGKFGSIYSKDYGNNIIDPLPHDKSYFEDHLLFAKNYFQKVSSERLTVEYTVLPNAITVSQGMKEYTPPAGSDDFTNIGNFIEEVWTLVDNNNPEIDFSQYDLFTIFNAGVGKDINVPGSFGNEKDLPSVYLNLNALQKAFGDSYNGVSVNEGNFNITNSMILPETENREIEGLTGSALLELSINGILTANIASHLGLPDLFNTETGLSAIGRFGLMDGQSIFAYSGLFPPAPSAWEKVFLGWADPIEVEVGKLNYSVTTAMAATLSDTVIIKVPINDKEYYLIENRARDANKDGLIVSYKQAGENKQRVIEKDTSGFYSFGVDTIPGVVYDIDEYDWAIPGSGIAIWHIDENIIEENIAVNKINVNSLFKGVDLEEADGVQDIGEEFTTITGDVVVGEGWEKDLWYADNGEPLFKNKFSIDTRPNTYANSGSQSLIQISDFSEIQNKMSFKVSFGDENIELIQTINFDMEIADVKIISDGNIENVFLLGGNKNLYKLSTNSTLELIQSDFSSGYISVLENNSSILLFGIDQSLLNVVSINSGEAELKTYNLTAQASQHLIIEEYGNELSIYIPLVDGNVDVFNSNQNYFDGLLFKETLELFNNEIETISVYENRLYAGTNGKYSFNGELLNIENYNPLRSILVRDENSIKVFSLSENNELFVFMNGSYESLQLDVSGQVTDFRLGLDDNGEIIIYYIDHNQLHALNSIGVELSNYPVMLKNDKPMYNNLIVLDYDNDKNDDCLVLSEDGQLNVFNILSGESFPGYPLSTSSKNQTIMVTEDHLVSVSSEGYYSRWKSDFTYSSVHWNGNLGNNLNNPILEKQISQNIIDEYFPQDRAYNWPNPVYGNETNIRYYVSEDSDVTIKIFDLSGDFVAELSDKAIGGYDNETIWNVSNIQSGIYFAHLQVNSTAGNSNSKIIKIAITK